MVPLALRHTQQRGGEQVRLTATLRDILIAQRGHLFGWVPVCLAVGIGGYFSLRFEPTWGMVGAGLVLALLCAGCAQVVHRMWHPVLLCVALICSGVGLAKWRTDSVAAPVLTFRYYGPIEGRVVGMDRSRSDALRLTLDQVRLSRIAPERMPARVRISVLGSLPDVPVVPGQVVMTTGHLSPPSGPAEPGGYNFQRHAWFVQLGGVGYTRNPLLRAEPADLNAWALRVFDARMAISRAVQAALPGEPGAFAAAIMSGDRSGMGQQTLANLRAANLAHLLAISGLHMGLLTAFVFAALRLLLVLIPGIGVRLPVKKLAACGALVAAAGYLALSGGNVATQRAFIMVAVMLVAILLGRRALTLRAVAMAAIIVLILRPEALTGPGFQMSFAATVALVAAFAWLRKFDQSALPRWFRSGLAVFVSSLVAGLATAPIAAAHFNQVSHYGLIANLLSVPLMGAIVVPAAVVAACAAPLGLGWIPLMIMGWGLSWILWVAETVSGQPGALSHVATPGDMVLPLIAFGFLWLVLWQGRLRMAGLMAMAMAGVIWAQTTRPDILVAQSGGLMGLMTDQGRALSRPRGDGFAASVWLENDGAPVSQDIAGTRAGITRGTRWFQANLGGWDVVQVSGKTALAALNGCDGADILLSNQADAADRPCLVLDETLLRTTGSVAFTLQEDGSLHVTTAQDVTGTRPWNAQSDASHVALPKELIPSAQQFARRGQTSQ